MGFRYQLVNWNLSIEQKALEVICAGLPKFIVLQTQTQATFMVIID